jgi:hypothetical protein
MVAVTCGLYGLIETDGHAGTRWFAEDSMRTVALTEPAGLNRSDIQIRSSARNDISRPLARLRGSNDPDEDLNESRVRLAHAPRSDAAQTSTPTSIPPAGAAVEQKSQGTREAARVVESFDGLGAGFEGSQGKANVRNPSDNSLAVGPDHVFQIVNTRVAIYTKKGKRFNTTGKILYGPVVTSAVFAGFGGQCETRNNGDAVVRYDQLAGRWLIVMPIFGRGPVRPDQP